ncbi:hypothetical protein PRIPAC_82019 [Pristionchus pacificus]|uniref:Uncharacterized protein n=1 Tax=Pristionchus pacificus TaxID=54126 RepID=A0A2A6CKB8_PRIPA|nr:hypothetical protein PRIPAC_82019 [Pristionchus pacificus]|eukprot:PDM78642.1 hypothetical protein PRIPAC_31221 [Pristionchus pacificus]
MMPHLSFMMNKHRQWMQFDGADWTNQSDDPDFDFPSSKPSSHHTPSSHGSGETSVKSQVSFQMTISVAFWALIKMEGLGPVDWSSFLITVAMAGERVLLPWFPIGLLMELRADRVPL